MLNRPRIIPCLTIINQDLVKTIKFEKPRYIGDPINTVKIFNVKGVDELCILDIRASCENREPNFEYLRSIASEAFMPLSYGGGITCLSQIKELIYIGFEKVIINSSFINNPSLIKEAVEFAGSQSIVISIDVKNDIFGKMSCYSRSGTLKIPKSVIELSIEAEKLGAGEILLTSINNDGVMSGYDIELVQLVSSVVNIPVIINGGAKDLCDFKQAIHVGGAHAVAASSMFIYYGERKAVLITYPTEEELVKNKVYENY